MNLHREARKRDEDIRLVDVGCGNGHTLGVLSERFSKLKLIGFEYTPELRDIAQKRFQSRKVQVMAGDIRDHNFAQGMKAHILICQRVLINLLDASDQSAALNHVVESTEPAS